MGDVILVCHKNTHPELCLILDIKKRRNYYEVEVLSSGKIHTIVDDGFYSLEVIAGET